MKLQKINKLQQKNNKIVIRKYEKYNENYNENDKILKNIEKINMENEETRNFEMINFIDLSFVQYSFIIYNFKIILKYFILSIV